MKLLPKAVCLKNVLNIINIVIHQALRLSEKEGIPTHLVNDFRQQLEIEKARLNSKEIKKDDLIKDSSRGGAVLGGKYVVSKFRQQ
jgi:hypothetical protein